MRRTILAVAALALSVCAGAADFTYSTSDPAKLAGLATEAKRAGMTSAQYLRFVVDAALDSYAKNNGATDPATIPEWKVQRDALVQQRDVAIAERDALKK